MVGIIYALLSLMRLTVQTMLDIENIFVFNDEIFDITQGLSVTM